MLVVSLPWGEAVKRLLVVMLSASVVGYSYAQKMMYHPNAGLDQPWGIMFGADQGKNWTRLTEACWLKKPWRFSGFTAAMQFHDKRPQFEDSGDWARSAGLNYTIVRLNVVNDGKQRNRCSVGTYAIGYPIGYRERPSNWQPISVKAWRPAWCPAHWPKEGVEPCGPDVKLMDFQPTRDLEPGEYAVYRQNTISYGQSKKFSQVISGVWEFGIQ